MEDLLENLNEEQREAVTQTEGLIRVIAGAGSGKTRALTARFAYLVNEAGIRPGNILCVTFTNKAAAEMRERIHALTNDRDTGLICTFHSFCVQVLKEDSHAVQYPKSFMVIDNSDIDAMLEMIYAERGLTLRDKTYGDARDMFEMRKCITDRKYYTDLLMMSLEDLYRKYMNSTEVNDILFYGYLYYEKKSFCLDYNDLIILTLHIFRENREIALKWQKRLEYIMIDEFQDIDPLQYELMEVLFAYHNNLFIVGDPDQTIYTWRGARIGYILNFDKRYQNVQTIMMMRSYRSTPEIIDAANALIAQNHDRIEKQLIPVKDHGQKVLYHHAADAHEEARWIAGRIEELHGRNIPYRDITVLYRAHYVSRAVEEVFLDRKIPYMIYSGVPFFARTEIKDALCYLRMLVYKDDISFARTVNHPKRNLGKRRMAFLKEYAEKNRKSLYESLVLNIDDPLFQKTKAAEYISLIEKFERQTKEKPVSQLLSEILDESGYETELRTEGSQERLDNLAELKQSVHEYEVSSQEDSDLDAYLNQIALYSNADAVQNSDRVRMMTVHAAKGLEFPNVFICGLSEGIFPSRKVNSESGMEEERRLAFVAFTRAEERLYLSDSGGKNPGMDEKYPSRFVLGISKDIIDYDVPLKDGLVRNAADYIADSERVLIRDNISFPFEAGDTVVHRIFGEGTVEEINAREAVIMVHFKKMNTSRGISFRMADKLTKKE